MARARRLDPSQIRRAVVLATAALVVALAVAGCGGASSDDAAPRTLSKRQYIERVNEIQADAPAIFVDMSRATKDPATARPHLAALDALIGRLDELRPPRAWADRHAQLLDALRDMRRAVDVLSRAPASKVAVVRTQVGVYTAARERYETAVRAINRSR